MQGRDSATKLITICLLVFFMLGVSENGRGALPDTSTCDVVPTIDFPTNVTISKDYLAVFSCGTPDFNAGDFVTAWIQDTEGSPVYTLNEYVETDTGIEWISPLSDNRGQAWETIILDPGKFDCNSTGVPYDINISWDAQNVSKKFNVFCPTLNLRQYKTELPYWDNLRVEVEVRDQRGYRMVGIPCRAKVLNLSINEDANTITIEQESEINITDKAGRAHFEFSTGLLTTLLQGYEYTTEISCLGTDTNFTFEVVEQNSQYLRNPLYNFMNWLGSNFVPILFGIIMAAIVFAVVGMLIKQLLDQN